MYIGLALFFSWHFTSLIENDLYPSLWKPPISLAIHSKKGFEITRNYFKSIKPPTVYFIISIPKEKKNH